MFSELIVVRLRVYLLYIPPPTSILPIQLAVKMKRLRRFLNFERDIKFDPIHCFRSFWF